jgi:hypothetical protein
MNVEIGPARDLGAVAELMNRTWKPPCWRYGKELLEGYLRRGKARPDLALELRLDGTLLGFTAAMPWQGFWRGKPIEAVFSSFLTVAREAAGFAGGLRLVRELLDRLLAGGPAQFLTVVETGQPYTELIPLLYERAGAPLRQVAAISRWLGPVAAVRPRLRGEGAERSKPGDAAAIEAFVQREAGRVDLLQKLPAGGDATGWILHEGGAVQGLVVARLREVRGDKPRRNLHVDCLLVAADLPVARREGFLDAALLDGIGGADLVVLHDGGVVDPAWAKARGFLRSNTRIDVLCAGLGVQELPAARSAVLEVY